jgi:hypothetical protein
MTCSRWVTICADIADHPDVGVKSGAHMAWWIYLIANVGWRDRVVSHKGRTLTLRRGQMLGGRAYLAREWGCTEKQVRGFLKKLEDKGMIEKVQSKGHFANVITICNYDAYQKNAADEGQCEGQSRASQGPVKGQTLTRDTTVTMDTREEDTSHETTTVVGAAPPPSAPAKTKSPRKVGERLPDDWVLPPEWKAWAVAEFGATEKAIAHQATLFRNHWTAKSGKDATKCNWERTWQSWCHKARQYTEQRGHKNGHANGAAVAFIGAKKDLDDWNAKHLAALERQLKDLEFQP